LEGFLVRRLLHAILSFFIIGILAGCSAQSTKADWNSTSGNFSNASSGKKVFVYYIKDGFLTPVTYNIDDTELEINAAVNLLFSGSVPEGFENEVFNTRVNTLKISGDTVTLDLSGDAFRWEREELARNQIVYTLTDCPNVLNVNITVEGQSYADSLRRPAFINLKNPEIYEQDKSDSKELSKYITIYYPDRTAKYLVPVTIKSDKIQVSETGNQKTYTAEAAVRAKAALQHLMEGAEEIGLGIDEKMIKSLQIDDGIAVVDLDRNILLNKFSTKTQYAEIAIKSVVRTLTAIDEIKKVQFLVDGVKMGYITGNINIQNPIEADRWYNFLNE